MGLFKGNQKRAHKSVFRLAKERRCQYRARREVACYPRGNIRGTKNIFSQNQPAGLLNRTRKCIFIARRRRKFHIEFVNSAICCQRNNSFAILIPMRQVNIIGFEQGFDFISQTDKGHFVVYVIDRCAR